LDKKKIIADQSQRKSKNDSFVANKPPKQKNMPKEYKPACDFAGNVRIVGESRGGQSSSPMSAQPLLRNQQDLMNSEKQTLEPFS